MAWIGDAAAQGWGDGKKKAPNVVLTQVEFLPNIRTHVTIGTARAWQTVSLKPDSEGRIEEIYVASGQDVEAGDKLLKLDSQQQELAAALARVRLEAAEKIFNRYKKLDSKGAVPAIQLENAEIELKTARITLAESELALSRRYVIAPFDGSLGILNLYPGAHITTSTEIVRLDNRSSLLLDFNMPENAVESISKGDEISINSVGGHITQNARVETVAHHVDPQTRSFGIRAIIDDPRASMMPGMSFKVSIETTSDNYPVVPEVAILWGSRGAYLWQVKDASAHRLPITVVRRKNGKVWIDADLHEGAIIVSEGVQKVREGDPIEMPAQNLSDTGDIEVTSHEQ